jgi:DNA repair exonuclease SbcCD ATPase subunit
MKIQKLHLTRYKPFKFKNIKRLVVDMTAEDTQILIGSNGSGKSSLLRECTPFPSVRSNFEKCGSKVVELEHEGSKYILTSRFAEAHSPHSFVKDTKELNISGATKIQHELIETHLGITPDIYKLITVGYDIANMSVSNRKNLLLNLNPTNMSLILDKHKKVCSKLREYKNNLKLLYKRKKDITDKLLNEDIINEIRKNQKILQAKKNTLNKWIYALETYMQTLKSDNIQCKPIDINKLQSDIRDIIKNSIDFSHISRDINHDIICGEYKNRIDNTETHIQQIENDIQSIIRELSEYEKYTNNDTDDKDKIVNRINELEKNISNIIIPDKYKEYILPKHEIDKLEISICHIKQLLSRFIEIPLISTDTSICDRIQHTINSLNYKIKDICLNKDQINKDLDDLNNSKLDTAIGYPSECHFDNCKLKTLYIEKVNSYETTKEKLLNKLKKVTNRYDRYIAAKSRLDEFYYKNKSSYETYMSLLGILNELYTTKMVFSNLATLEVLNTKPNSISHYLDNLMEMSKLYHKRVELVEELDIFKKQEKAINSPNNMSAELIQKIITDKQKHLSRLYDKLDLVISQSKKEKEEYQTLVKYTETVKYIKNIQEVYKTYAYTQERDSVLQYYQKLIDIMYSLINEYDTTLLDINETIKEQDSLSDRLNQEIQIMIDDIEKDKLKYDQIEKALSPTSGIPHTHMIRFLNTIISNTNKFISKVWSYHLQLIPLDYNKPIDYQFAIQVGNIKVNDISTCSDGQKTIINLAFALAMVVQLKLHDYPLYVDEIDKYLDPTHAQVLIELFGWLIDNKLIGQLLMINHNSIMEGIRGDILVMDETNVVLPTTYNEHVIMDKY